MARKVAFFDIDGTVFRSSLLIELVRQLVSKGVFPCDALDEFQDEYDAWLNREGSYERYIGAVVQTFLRHLKGVHYGAFADIGKAVVLEQSKHVYRYTRDLIGTLKVEGYYLVAISQSPKTILDEFCAGYGFDKVYGRLYEIGPQDGFTGEVVEVHLIENKANILNRVFSKEDVAREGSIGVGDTEGDISLLEGVDRAICFNPNQRLFDHARRVGWEVVVERKDVIYKL